MHADIFSNAAAELLNLHYPYPLSPEKHSSPDHLHVHQTVSISIMMMRPLAPIYPSLHLGVIRCYAFLRKIRKPSVKRYSSDLSVLHMVAYYCCSSYPHHFLHISPRYPSTVGGKERCVSSVMLIQPAHSDGRPFTRLRQRRGKREEKWGRRQNG